MVDAVEESRLTKFYPKNTIWAIVGFAIFGTLFFLPLILYFDIYTVIEDECTNSTQCYMGVMNSDVRFSTCSLKSSTPDKTNKNTQLYRKYI